MRIVVCDDHLLLLEALGLALGARGHEVVALAGTPQEAIKAVAMHQPDVCLLDVNFPEGTSVSAIHEIRDISPATKVVMLSAEADHSIVGRAIAEGASGYVGKEKPIVEIVEMLDRAVRGQLAVEPSLLQRALRPQKTTDDPLWALQFLTDREWQVMRCIMDGQTTEEMATTLGVQRSTARTHVQNLLTKLGVHSRLQAAALMSAHGSHESWPVHLR
jgi:two-component system nitrate/nitrite response regulator NarL